MIENEKRKEEAVKVLHHVEPSALSVPTKPDFNRSGKMNISAPHVKTQRKLQTSKRLIFYTRRGTYLIFAQEDEKGVER